MSWLDKIAKKRLAELEEHPELNDQNYSQKLNSIIFLYCTICGCHTYSFVLV